MKFSFKTSATALFILMSVVLFSCKKESSVPAVQVTEEEAQTISEESAEADASYDDAAEIGLSLSSDVEAVIGGVNNSNGNFGMNGAADGRLEFNLNLFEDLAAKVGPCTKITVEPMDSTFPKKITIDYGDGCICRDGKFRKGAVILHYTAPIRRPGAVLTITFRGFYVNRAHIEGTKIIKNESENGAIAYSKAVVNGKITFPNGRGFSYTGVKHVTQVRGMETRTVRDDVYTIEGRSETKYNNGVTVTKNTESPLVKAVSCNWISKGVLKIKINDRVLYLDYSYNNSDCDNLALLKWATGEKVIRLPL
ncbi:MAG: hypothetical protein SFU21_05960 [Flavihumibacter sp.]|nr:hypothetical protein [Flavihumibacter sp.]